MAQNGTLSNGSYPTHAYHDSALSVGSSKQEDTARIRDLEDEVRILAEKANAACMLGPYAWKSTDCLC